MAGVILSRSKYADKPYYISNMSINIYSMEELCYYIYNNIYLIGTDLVDDGLITYIADVLGETELAGQLEYLTSQEAGLSEIVITILRYVDYYSEEEIQELKAVIDKLDMQNAAERLKARADNFLNNRRFDSAIRNYELIVYGKRDTSLPVNFYGDVWHNMGVAYGRMFYYKDAEICFKTAYELNQNENSLKASVVARFLGQGTVIPDEEDELAYVICREIETIMDHVTEEPEYLPVKTALELKNEGRISEYHEAMNNIVASWKSEYRNYMK